MRAPAKVIILCLYVVSLWLVFSKFKFVRCGWLSGTVSVLVGVFILATFVTVAGRVVEVTPNVTGQIVAIPVKPNVPVKIAAERQARTGFRDRWRQHHSRAD